MCVHFRIKILVVDEDELQNGFFLSVNINLLDLIEMSVKNIWTRDFSPFIIYLSQPYIFDGRQNVFLTESVVHKHGIRTCPTFWTHGPGKDKLEDHVYKNIQKGDLV